jgi:hypothetical protein
MKIDDISWSRSAPILTADSGEHDLSDPTSSLSMSQASGNNLWDSNVNVPCLGEHSLGFNQPALNLIPDHQNLGEHDLLDSTRSLPMSLQTTLLNSITLTSQKTLPAAGEDRSPPPQNETKMIQRLSPKRREEGISGREILDRIAKGRTIEESKILGDSESDKDMGRHSEAEGNEILKRRIDGEMGLVKKEKGG